MKQISVLPCTGGGGPLREVISCAFTMAEILLSLTIIGVVAAITLPSLTGNINERTWNTQRKALYARMSQAISLMPALNGYGTLTEDSSTGSVEDTATETFITSGLSKVLKINNICDNEHLADCGINSNIITLAGSKIDTPTKMSELNISMTNMYISNSGGDTYSYSQIDTKATAFETANGESVIAFYYPKCVAKTTTSIQTQRSTCVNFVYDLNGNKGPNTVGKDIGVITVLYPTDSVVVAPYPHPQNAKEGVNFQDASKACPQQDPDYRVPNLEELASIYVNKDLFGMTGKLYLWTSTVSPNDVTKAYNLNGTGLIFPESKDWERNSVRCIKR